MKLIALTGLAGSGKDTVADHLVEHHGFFKYSFAYPIKQALNSMFGWTMEMWDDREWKERVIPKFGKSPRQMAQTLGTEWGRELINPDLCVILAAQNALEHSKVVIPDCRFDNEAKMVRNEKGKILNIVRPGTHQMSHSSEAGVNKLYIDLNIPNNGTIEQLLTRVDVAIDSIRIPRC